MKVNLKKIGAIVAGATILASSVAFAGLTFGSTQLVDDNGAPVAKVVIGANAAASDGVAAALIASKLVSAAYKSNTLTAQVSGTPTCSAGGATGGSCTVSDEKATLEITVPGSAIAGTYTMNNLIGDYLNRELLDRNQGQQEYTLGADTSDSANPFSDGLGGSIGPSGTAMFRIDGTMFSPLMTTTLQDSSAAKSYSEQQNIWLKGNNHWSDTPANIAGKLDFVSYTLKFKGTSDDLGVPVCTTPTNNDYTACKMVGGNIDYATETHKMAVKFLGEDWIVSEMSPPTGVNLTSETQLVAGGYVKLAKESVAGILNQGESLTADDLKFQLDDLEAHGDTTSAIISVLDANGNVLKKDTIPPGTTKEFVLNGKSYRFHVYKVAPGYTFGAKWADVAIYSTELKIQNGQRLDPDYDTNKYWTAYVGWKNKGAGTDDGNPDHLRTIILYSDQTDKLSTGGQTDIAPGDSIPFVTDPQMWKLSYKGVDLGTDQYDSLQFYMEKSSDYTISSTYGPMNATTRVNCTITAPFVRVQSGKSGAVFTANSVLGAGAGATDASDNEFWVATSGAVCAGGIGALPPGTLFMRASSSSDYWTYKGYAANMTVKYPDIGDGDQSWVLGGVIEWANASDASLPTNTDIANSGGFNFTGTSGSTVDWIFAFSEKAGVGSSNTFTDKMFFGQHLAGSSSDFNIDNYNASNVQQLKKDNILYKFAGPVDTGSAFGKEGYISERGTKYTSTDSTSVAFDMANTLGHAQWFLASVAVNATPGTTIWTGGEGDQTTVSGVTVKIDKIDETAVCSGGAGGTPACSPNMSGVGAVIMPDNAASVTAAVPYDFSKYSPLVMLDTDAVGVSTVISVGGDAVNTVTASILSGTTVDWTAQPQMVKEVVKGSKIVVAGYTADDTLAAANTFVSQLS